MRVCPNDDEVRDAFPMATEEGLKFFRTRGYCARNMYVLSKKFRVR